MSIFAPERWSKRMPPIGGVKHVGQGNPTYSGNTPEDKKMRRFKTKDQIDNPQHHGKDIASNRMARNGSSIPGHSGYEGGNGNMMLSFDEDGIPARNKRSVWTVTTKPYKGAHFAVYPPELIKPCILAGCPAGGIVLDPFFGSGTTGATAKELGRDFIGIELNQKYIKLAEKRIAAINPPLFTER
jgi:DNA modification methylase